MAQIYTKSMARNVFYGGSVFFVLVFLGLTWHTESVIPERDNRGAMTEQVADGKRLWEVNNCIGCHTLLGEGAYFAPELGNAVKRLGSKAGVMAYIKSRPAAGIPGRRNMPQYNFSEAELEAIAEFLEYVSNINTGDWPPNIQG